MLSRQKKGAEATARRNLGRTFRWRPLTLSSPRKFQGGPLKRCRGERSEGLGETLHNHCRTDPTSASSHHKAEAAIAGIKGWRLLHQAAWPTGFHRGTAVSGTIAVTGGQPAVTALTHATTLVMAAPTPAAATSATIVATRPPVAESDSASEARRAIQAAAAAVAQAAATATAARADRPNRRQARSPRARPNRHQKCRRAARAPNGPARAQ